MENQNSKAGEILISWTITPQERLQRQRLAFPLTLPVLVSVSLSLIYLSYIRHTPLWFSLLLGGLVFFTGFFVLLFYTPKYSTTYIIGTKGIVYKKKKEKFYPWDKLKSFYLMDEIKKGYQEIAEIESITGKVFVVRKKGFWGLLPLVIQAEPDNSKKLKGILKTYLPYKPYKPPGVKFLALIFIIIITLIVLSIIL